MSTVERRSTICCLSQVLATQVARDTRVKLNPNASTTSSRIRDFTRINPPNFYVSKVKELSKVFIDEAYKILYAMGLTTSDKAELATYKLKDMSQALYVQCLYEVDP